MKKIFDFENKKVNLIVTSVLLILAILITVFSGIAFASFRNYEAWFDTSRVDHTYKFSEFSPNLKGTIGDSDIYQITGSKNTVAVVKSGSEADFANVAAVKTANSVVGVAGSESLTIATEALSGTTIATEADAKTALDKVADGTYKVAVVSFGDYKAYSGKDGLAVAEATIEDVPSILVMGGTHPNEPSGQLGATVFLENASVSRGILYVITEVNRSAYSHSQPQEATMWFYDIELADGTTRTFKFGSRATNTVDQWPTPDVYTHSPIKQQLSASESRNINRAYPGSENGTYTEQLAHAVTNFVLTKNVTMVVDLHEASPEYITINAIVAHQDAGDIMNSALLGLEMNFENSFEMGNEISPVNMRGLTHRELGDYTNAYAFLCETSNASQGKYRGAFTDDLITYYTTCHNEKCSLYGKRAVGETCAECGQAIYGPDKFYEYAASKSTLENQLLYARPVSIDERVGRHVQMILQLIDAFNETGMTRDTASSQYCNLDDSLKQTGKYVGKLEMTGIPTYSQLYNDGVGQFLSSQSK